MRTGTALLILLAGAHALAAQSPSGSAGDNLWSARLAVGWISQDTYPYARHGLALGGTVARAMGERTVARVDVTHASFSARVDLTGCSGLGIGGSCTGTVRAPDKQQQWLLSLTLEQRLQQPGFYVLAGLATAYSRGRALDQPGLAPGATIGIGLRFGETLAVEARFVQLLGPPRREGWLVPVVVSLGP